MSEQDKEPQTDRNVKKLTYRNLVWLGHRIIKNGTRLVRDVVSLSVLTVSHYVILNPDQFREVQTYFAYTAVMAILTYYMKQAK